MGTVAVLNGRTMDVDSDGGYTITVDSGRPVGQNHDAEHGGPRFYIRDVLLDWQRDDPNHCGGTTRSRHPTPARTRDEQAKPPRR